MSDNMVERVARAIAAVSDDAVEEFDYKLARAAIEAMRELPSGLADYGRRYANNGELTVSWTAVIDEILEPRMSK